MKEYPHLSQAIGNTIEIFRKDRRMTKSALAEFAWLERRYLREIEQGDKKAYGERRLLNLRGSRRFTP